MKYFLSFLILFFPIQATGQSNPVFYKELNKVIHSDINESDLNTIMQDFPTLLTPHGGASKYFAELNGYEVKEFPLNYLRKDTLYKNNILELTTSQNDYKRILAYLLIASSGDISLEKQLLEKLDEEVNRGNKIWCAMALLHLKTSHTTRTFYFIVENESLGDPHFLPMLNELPKDSLKVTAQNAIQSESRRARIFATQILANLDPDNQTEELLKDAVKEWEMDLKGYAIFAIKELETGNLSELLKPYLSESNISNIALQALANSPTEEDQKFLHKQILEQDKVSEPYLRALSSSTRIENIRKWLQIIQSEPQIEHYYFGVEDQILFFEEEILGDVQKTILNVENDSWKYSLLPILEGRSDNVSIDILISMLHEENISLRNLAARLLFETESQQVKNEIPKLLRDSVKRTTSLVELAINHSVDSLQTHFADLYNKTNEPKWQSFSLKYLAAFPKEEHIEIFREVLKDDKSDFFFKKDAAIGLGNLQDEESVDLIITSAEKVSNGLDSNMRHFLIVLSKIDSNKAWDYILEYKDSQDQGIRELVNELLNSRVVTK